LPKTISASRQQLAIAQGVAANELDTRSQKAPLSDMRLQQALQQQETSQRQNISTASPFGWLLDLVVLFEPLRA
jgi:hypothetical protein